MGVNDLIAWLTGADGGAFIFITWALSWAFEEATWWQALSSKLKSLIILILSALLGVGSVALQQNPALVAALEPYLQPVIYIVIAWLGTQVAHRINPAKKSGSA